MLLHWLNVLTDEVTISVRQNNIVLRRFKGWFGNTKCIDKQKVSLKKWLNYHDDEQGYLTQLLDATLNDKRWHARTARVVFSNYFVRYSVIPWRSGIRTNEERQAFLQHHFVHIYGDVIASWNKSISPSGYGKPALASAIPLQILQPIEDVFSSSSIKLLSIEPNLMLVANEALDLIKKHQLQSQCWLTMIADDRVCICLMIDGQWFWVKNVQQEADVIKQIELTIEREKLINADLSDVLKHDHKHVMVLYCPEIPAAKTIKIANYRVIRLTTKNSFFAESIESLNTRLMML